MSRCPTCDSRICKDCSDETDIIDWSNPHILRMAIWGIYGWTDSITTRKWKEDYSDQIIPERLINNSYMIKVTTEVTYYGWYNDHEYWSYDKYFETTLPFIVGLTKDNFNDDCTMDENSYFWDHYAPSEKEIPNVIDAKEVEIKNIRIILISKNKTQLDLTWSN